MFVFFVIFIYMAKIKFTVIDESTIALAQDAKKGDTIDLSEVNELDLNVLSIRLIEKINGVAEEKANKLAAKTKKDLEESLVTKIELEKQKINSNFEKALAKEHEEKVKLENKIATFEQQKELEVTKAIQKEQTKAQIEKEALQKKINDDFVDIKTLSEKLSTQKSNYEMQKKILEDENKKIREFNESRSTKM